MPARLPLLLVLLLATGAHAAEPLDSAGRIADDRFNNVLAGDWRSPENRLLDPGRRPVETLRFFDLTHSQTVIEINPGDGWYSEIIAPLVRDEGQYVAALAKGADEPLRRKFEQDPARYDKVRVLDFDPRQPVLGKPQSADLVLSFDDVQDWTAAKADGAMFEAAYQVLKPGGKFGVVAYRAEQGAKPEAAEETGYLPTDYVVQKAKDAGFVLATVEQMHSNPQDARDRPAEEEGHDRAGHQVVGEPDRMTVLFVKPAEQPGEEPAPTR